MRTLLFAISYYTRIPVSMRSWPDVGAMRASLAWLPLVGCIAGLVAGGIWYGACILWSAKLATLLGMASLFLLTGAMHEDGFADSCDGLGVAGPAERILQVLKDPQMGTFGVIGVGMLLLLRYTFWSGLSIDSWYWIPLTEAVSRLAIPVWSWTRPYARKEGPSKAPFLRADTRTSTSWSIWSILIFLTCASLFALTGIRGIVAALMGACASAIPIYLYHRKIGGVTGDVLGASQQCALVATWLALTAKVCQ